MRRAVLIPFCAGIAVVALVVGGLAIARSGASTGSGIDPATAQAMALSSRMEGHTDSPACTLVDQHGREVSLRSLRGRVVVLTFLDPHCIDICPIISAEFVRADRLLGAHRGDVAIVAINVNPYATSTGDVLAYARAHQLEGLGNFRFLTGTGAGLAAVWKDYGVFVQAPDPATDVVHTSVTYFLDRSGVIRYMAMPNVDHRSDGSSYLPQGSIDTWGKGIAQVAEALRG
jgi:cytochrome oxidase Cu insertion factor (SCO1/SenC/PrrC family)